MTCRAEDIGTESRELHPNLVYAMAHMKPKTSDRITRKYVGLIEDQGEASRTFNSFRKYRDSLAEYSEATA